jgi:hypothetical protein
MDNLSRGRMVGQIAGEKIVKMILIKHVLLLFKLHMKITLNI